MTWSADPLEAVVPVVVYIANPMTSAIDALGITLLSSSS